MAKLFQISQALHQPMPDERRPVGQADIELHQQRKHGDEQHQDLRRQRQPEAEPRGFARAAGGREAASDTRRVARRLSRALIA